MIEPSVGRVVWYYKYVEGQGFKGPLAAHIAHVHSDNMVNLMVIDQNGNPHGETSVPLEQEDNDAHMGSYCTWMPFQKGQAAKTEEAERKLAGK